jgi:mannose-6-phosphate isomerase class I
VVSGWGALADRAARTNLLAVDGPECAPWERLLKELRCGLERSSLAMRARDARAGLASWETILAKTSSTALAADADFEMLSGATLEDLVERPVQPAAAGVGTVSVVFGPGAALSRHDELWYFDLPKRYAEAAVPSGTVRNLGQRAGQQATTRRLFYVDWPVLDRHRAAIAGDVSLWIDAQEPERPTALAGTTLAATAAALVHRPFRTLPTFNTTPWGGHWGQRTLGLGTGQPNTAVGYELIAPESGVLIGHRPEASVEVPFQLLVSLHPVEVLGASVHQEFGTSFPIRFDYLDTVDGGDLSVHCHPQPADMREIFGWPYAQHETYYVMVAHPGSEIFLGLREDARLDAFRREATRAEETGQPFDIRRHVQTMPAAQHQLYLVPAGTPHASSAGNVVLEVSATPYLYSLRFYDWLRRDGEDRQRPVHVDLAFRNLDPKRRGSLVENELVPPPRPLRSGPGWHEELLGDHPQMFFDVCRLNLSAGAPAADDTAGRFHVLNVVAGAGATIRTAAGADLTLCYGETAVIPAAVGAYTVEAWPLRPVRVVKAYVR